MIDDGSLARPFMAGGGERVEVAPHDLAIIVGAIGLVGAIGIALFALPQIVDFGETSSVEQISSISVGILGSSDDVVVEANPLCEGNDTCVINSIKLIGEDGSELSSLNSFDGDENGKFTATLPAEEGGSVIVEVNGQGTWEISVTANRQIPVQFLPAIVSILILVWGIWRKMQEVDGDADISQVVDKN